MLGISNLPEEVAKSLAMDIEYRIHEIIEQGLKFMRHSKRTTLTTDDISHALRVLNVEPLYGYQSSAPVSYREAMVGPGQTLYYIDEDEDVDFEKIINQPLPKVPRSVSFTAHWLAIEGVQPAIPQNPQPSEVRAMAPQIRGAQQSHSIASLSTTDMEVKPLVKHVISKELQLYFDRVAAALVSTSPGEETLRNSALSSLRNDPGLHQLVPYFVQFVQEKMTQEHKRSLAIMFTMLSVIDALLSNPTIFIEPYVHHLMPAVMTALLAKRIGPKPVSDESYRVRDMAASLLKTIADRYGPSYHTLKPRVARTLLKKFMDSNSKSAGSYYGAIMGILSLGPEMVRVIILGNAKAWYEGVVSRLPEEDQTVVCKVLLEALRSLKSQVPDSAPESIDESALESKVGPQLKGYILEQDDGTSIANAVLFGDFDEK